MLKEVKEMHLLLVLKGIKAQGLALFLRNLLENSPILIMKAPMMTRAVKLSINTSRNPSQN